MNILLRLPKKKDQYLSLARSTKCPAPMKGLI